MKVNMEERLPQVVEDRLKEAYEQIRRGEIKQMNKVTDPDWEASRKERKTDGRKRKTGSFRRGLGAAAAVLALVIIIPSAVYAAVTYFRKNVREEGNNITYEFTLNYELVPGEYQVKAAYIPKGFADHDHADLHYSGDRADKQ